jgi:uncharacterized protein (DUF342 family)
MRRRGRDADGIGVGRLRIRTLDKNMTAVAQATAGPPATADAVREALAAAKVTNGVDAAAIESFGGRLADAAFAGEAVVARGLPPVPGEDGRVDGMSPPAKVAGTPREDGSLDYRERMFLVGVSAGTELGRIVPPTPGTPGKDVCGATVLATPGKPTTIRPGPGTRLQGDAVIASHDGVLLRNAKTIDVVPLFAHGGDVDYRCGNLHTAGSLSIEGDVRDGFSATASGDAQVTGAVSDGLVFASGSVNVTQGVVGRNAKIIAGHDAYCRHATSATIEADGAVEIADQATHCRIRADTILVKDGKGVVFGGELRARTRITVRTAGSAGATTTTFVVGDVLQDVAASVRASGGSAKLDVTTRQRGIAMSRTSLREVDAAVEERLRLLKRKRDLLVGAVVEFLDTVHPGVVVLFGDKTWTCEEPRQGVRLRWSDQDDSIHEEPLR